MAALTPTKYEIHRDAAAGSLFGFVTFRVTTGAASASEYVVCSGVERIISVLGCVPVGTAPATVVAPVAATGTVTFSDVNVDTKLVTIDGIIYASATAPATDGTTPRSYDVEATAAAAAQGLADAINAGNGQGAEVAALPGASTFGTGAAPHPSVKASVSGAVVTLTARVPGSAGNAITLTTNETNAVVSGATLAGGADVVAGANVVLNAAGTGQTEGTALGTLGIESPAAATYQVTLFVRFS